MSLCPTRYWGNQSLGESPVPGLSGWKVPEATLKACVPFFFLPYPCPLDTSQFLQHPLGRVLSSIGGATLRKEVGGGNPTTRRKEAHRAFQSSSLPVSLHLEVVGPCRGEQAHQIHGAGLIGWHTLPSSVNPMTVHPWEPSLPRLQGCDSSPSHRSLRGIELTFTLCNLYFVLVCR